MDRQRRQLLTSALLDAAPWLAAADVGPRAVVAGACDRCGSAPRLLPTCGPGSYEALCRDCALALDDDGWCAGHLDDGRQARAWAEGLPDHWGDAVVLWWIATGEIRAETATPEDAAPLGAELGERVRSALTGGADGTERAQAST